MRSAAPLLLLLLPLMAACAGDPRWVNPSLPKEHMSSDLADCRHLADREFGRSPLSDAGTERTGDPMKLVDRTQDQKRFNALVGMCMEDKGYQPAK